MGRLEAIRIFTRVAETNSFTKAADMMDLPRGTVSRSIQALESDVGVRLISRSTRQVSLTDAGRIYYECCAKVLAELSDVEATLGKSGSSPAGTVRIDTSGTIAGTLIVPYLDEFFERFPEVEVRIGISDKNVDLVSEGVDCVIRAGELEESSLVARRIGNAAVVMCASAAYLNRNGVPTSLEELADHTAINYVSARTGKLQPFLFHSDGELIKLTLKSKIAVNNGNTYIDSAVMGLGIIQVSRYMVRELLEVDKLRTILPDLKSPSIALSTVFPSRNHITSATRAFTTWIAEVCRRHPDIISTQ